MVRGSMCGEDRTLDGSTLGFIITGPLEVVRARGEEAGGVEYSGMLTLMLTLVPALFATLVNALEFGLERICRLTEGGIA